MKRYSNHLILVLLSLFAASCNDSQDNPVATSPIEKVISMPAGDVLFDGSEFVFETENAFREYHTKIASDAIFKAQIESKYANVLLSGQADNRDFKKGYLFYNLPLTYYALVNKDGRVTIGDYAIKFDSLYQYSVPRKDASILVSKDFSTGDGRVTRNTYGRTLVQISSNLRTDTQINGNGGLTTHQHNFTYLAPDPYAGQPTKYVNQMLGHIALINPGAGIYHRTLVLSHKLEYISGSGNVYPAYQPRNVTDNLSISGFLYWNNKHHYFSKTVNQTFSAVTNEVGGFVHEEWTGSGGGNGFWDFTVTGSIVSNVISSNHNYTWTQSGNIW